MLKIKDNVDLKELEKFGFEKDRWKCYIKTICEGRRGQSFELIISSNRRVLEGFSNGADGSGEEADLDDTLYDLIKADLVEKVDDNNGK